MTKFCTNRNKQTILIESIPYSNWEIEMVRMNIPADNRSFRQELFSFLSEWFDPADTLLVHTSGSTGKPKELHVEKEHMMESACLTCSFLGLQKEDSALLCSTCLGSGIGLAACHSIRASFKRPDKSPRLCCHDPHASL